MGYYDKTRWRTLSGLDRHISSRIVSPDNNFSKWYSLHRGTGARDIYRDTVQHFSKKAFEIEKKKLPKPMYVEESFFDTLENEYGDKRRILSMHIEISEEAYKYGDFYKMRSVLCVAIDEFVDDSVCPTILSNNHREYLFPRNECTPQDIEELNGVTVNDVIVRFGLNPNTRRYSSICKWVAVVLEDGRMVSLHGDKIEEFRWGDECGEGVLPELEPVHGDGEDGLYMELDDEHWTDADYDDYAGEVDEMAEMGAQFSWLE